MLEWVNILICFTCKPKDCACLWSPSVNRRPLVIICSMAFLKQSTIIICSILFLSGFSICSHEPFLDLTNGCQGGGLSSCGKPEAAGGKNFFGSAWDENKMRPTYLIIRLMRIIWGFHLIIFTHPLDISWNQPRLRGHVRLRLPVQMFHFSVADNQVGIRILGYRLYMTEDILKYLIFWKYAGGAKLSYSLLQRRPGLCCDFQIVHVVMWML